MGRITTKPRPADTEKSNRDDKRRYTFKNASELPRSKPDYVVQYPTPLGRRAVPQSNKEE